MQQKLLIALAFSLLVTPGLKAQQKFLVPPPRSLHSPTPAPAVPPQAPLPPEQLPASPPEVQYREGQLTIMASNSTLGDILRAVRQQTGASVDVPGNATERVVGQFGPGPARDVLASLLNGSHFNYVLLGSAENPVALDRVILTSRSGAGGGSEQPEPANASMSQMQPNPATTAVPQPDDSDDTASDDAAEAPDATDADDQGATAQGDDQPQQQQPPNALGQPGGVKTPEQLLQELQQRQQQLQQQGNPGAPGYPAPGMPRQQ